METGRPVVPLARETEASIELDEFDRMMGVRSPGSSGSHSDGFSEGDVPIEMPVSWWKRIQLFIFPPDVPRQVQLWRRENIAIPLCYLMVGTFQGLSSAVLNVYPLEIEATEAQQLTVKVLKSLPASFKIIFGLLSDGFPVFGYKRKIYMAAGWGLASASCAILAMIGQPNIEMLSLFTFLFSLGMWFADVMGDSLVAEKAKLEPETHRGELQSLCYACRFFMLMITVILSTFLFETIDISSIFWTLALLPVLFMFPSIYYLYEQRYAAIAPIKTQLHDIWVAVSSQAVWQPMGFIFVYNMMQVSNAAWNQYLRTGLHFTSLQLNSFLVSAYALTFFGVLAYKRYLRDVSWRKVYLYTTLLNGVFSTLQFLLIFRINRKLGIDDFLFALGDDVFAEFVAGIQFLPTTILMVHLTPAGSEGAAYSIFTTFSNSAYGVASSISTWLLRIWDVSAERFEEEPPNVSGMWRLSLLTTSIQLAALFFLPLLPHGKDGLKKLGEMGQSFRGGAIFLLVLGTSLLWAVITAIVNIADE